MLRINTVIILFIVIAVDKINCVSFGSEEEINNSTLRDLLRDDTATENSSLEARRSTRSLEESIETPSGESDSISYPDIQTYSRGRLYSGRGHDRHSSNHDHHRGGHYGTHLGHHSHSPKRLHGHHPGGHNAHHPGGHHHHNFSGVFMPTGKMANISVPKELEGWKCRRPTIRINMDPHGKYGREYNLVANEVRSTKRHRHFSSYRFIKIEKIVNGCVWKRYRASQMAINLEAGYVNERMLFHGTSKVDDVLKNGFDERFTQIDGNMFGAGIYFAKHSSKSNGYAVSYKNGCSVHHNKNCDKCERQMMLCRVALGKMQVETAAKAIPHPDPGYNSVMAVATHRPGGLHFPEYVVYKGEQVYPEYVITYKIVI